MSAPYVAELHHDGAWWGDGPGRPVWRVVRKSSHDHWLCEAYSERSARKIAAALNRSSAMAQHPAGKRGES